MMLGGAVIATVEETRGALDAIHERDLPGTLRYFDASSKCGVELDGEAPTKIKTPISNGQPHFTCKKDKTGEVLEQAVYLEPSKVKVKPNFSPPAMCYKIGDSIRNTVRNGNYMQVCTIVNTAANGHYEVRYHHDDSHAKLVLCVGDHYLVPTAHYDVKQQIMVFANNAWNEYSVEKELGGSKHALSANVSGLKITCNLNPANHFVHRMGKDEYAKVLEGFLKQCIDDNVYVQDGITKAVLHIGEQLVSIGLDEVKEEGGGGTAANAESCAVGDLLVLKSGESATKSLKAGEKYEVVQKINSDGDVQLKLAGGEATYFKASKLMPYVPPSDVDEIVDVQPYISVKNVFELCKVLVAGSPAGRTSGVHFAQPLLVKAGAGTGKTWLTKQLLFAVSRTANDDMHSRYIPFLLPVQRLAFEMRRFQSENPDTVLAEAIKPNLLVWYIDQVYGSENPQIRNLLLDAFDSKRLLLILDGIDEAADLKSEVQDLIQNILLPCQIRFMATSRPEGLRESLYRRGFVVLTLKPYTKEQQDQVLSKQLEGRSRVFVDNVRNFSEAFRTLDEIYNTYRSDLESIEAIAPFDLTFVKSKGVFSKYAQQVMPGGVPAATVEQLHLAAAEAKPIFDQELMTIAENLSMEVSYSTADMLERGTGLILVVEKRIDRSRSKCIAKYQPEVEAGRRPQPAASWATDIVRASFVCNNIRQILHLLAMLRDNPLFTIVRLKNLFLALDPTHFRRIMLTIRVQLNKVDGTQYWHNVEVQIHHREIFKLKMTNEEIMHTPYEYFRDLFGAQMTKQLDAKAGWLSIESRMRLWRDILEVPVLMSLFILLLREVTKGDFDKSKLPNNEVDLYRTSIGIMINEVSENAGVFKVIYDTLRKVAYANHLYGRREFTSDHLQEGLFRQYEVGLPVVPSPSNESKIPEGKYKIDQLCQKPGDSDFGKVVIRLRDVNTARAALLKRTQNIMILEKISHSGYNWAGKYARMEQTNTNTNTFYIRHKLTGKYLSFKKSDFKARKYHDSALTFQEKGPNAVEFKRVGIRKGVTSKLENATITVSEFEAILVPSSRLIPNREKICLAKNLPKLREIIQWSTLELDESPGDVFLVHHTFDSVIKFKVGNEVIFTAAACKEYGDDYGFIPGQLYKIVYGPDSDGDCKVKYTIASGANKQTKTSGYIKTVKFKPKTRDQLTEPTSAVLCFATDGTARFEKKYEMTGGPPDFNILMVSSNVETVFSSSIVPDAPSNANSALWAAFGPILLKSGEDTLRIPTLKILDDVADESSGAVLNFQSVHLSLQEFLCADYLAEQVVTNRARFAMGRALEFMDWDYNSLLGVKALFEEPRHKNMLKFLGQLGAADQMLQFPGDAEDLATQTWDADTGLLRFTKWGLSSGATERMITFTAGSVLAGQATKLVLTGCLMPGLTGEILLALSRFGFLEELDMRRSTSKQGSTSSRGGDEKINEWQLTWSEMVTAVRDAHHPTLQRVLLQDNVGALMQSNPTLFPIEQIKMDPASSTFKVVKVVPARDVTGESPPKVVKRMLTGAESTQLFAVSAPNSRVVAKFKDDENGEYLWSRGWEVPVIAGKCTITFVEKNPPRLASGAYDHKQYGDASSGYSDGGWKFFGVCSSLPF